MKKVYQTIVKNRESSSAQSGESNDLLDALIKIKNESSDKNEGMYVPHISSQLMNYFLNFNTIVFISINFYAAEGYFSFMFILIYFISHLCSFSFLVFLIFHFILSVTEDLLFAQAAIFLFGGFETSGSVLTFITYELAFHPEIQVSNVSSFL